MRKTSNLVAYDNKMNNVKFYNFSKIDQNIFFALCAKMKDCGDNIMSFEFDELRKLINYKKSNSQDVFINDLKKMHERLIHISCSFETDNDFCAFILFPTYRIDKEKKQLTIRINPDFTFLLNKLSMNFTMFDLIEFVNIESKYGKTLFRVLKQFRTTGFYEVSVEKLRELLDAPKSYNNKQFMQNVLRPAIESLGDYFQELKVDTKRDLHRRGQPITGYCFSFRADKRKKSQGIDETKHTTSANPEPSKKPTPTRGMEREHTKDFYEQLEMQLLKS